MVQGLAGNELIKSSYGFARFLKRSPQIARCAGVGSSEGKQVYLAGKKSFKPGGIGLGTSALRNSIPQLEHRYRRHENCMAIVNDLFITSPDWEWFAVDERDTSVRIEQVIHSNTLRRGARGCLRPLAMKGPACR